MESSIKFLSNNKAVQELAKLRTVDKTCPIHPEQQLVQLPGKPPFCPKCQQAAIAQQNQRMAKFYTAKFKKRQTTETLQRDSIFDDPELGKATFNTFQAVGEEAQRNFNLARHIAGEYLDPAVKFNTLFTGDPGRGKSHLALSILKTVNEHSPKPTACLFINVNELFRLIKAGFGYTNEDYKYTEDNMTKLLTKKTDLLVLDDLGAEASFKRFDKHNPTQASEYVQRVLYGIVNGRNRTIITTNLTSEQLSTMYNPKLVSRLYTGIKGHIIKFTNATQDHRGIEF